MQYGHKTETAWERNHAVFLVKQEGGLSALCLFMEGVITGTIGFFDLFSGIGGLREGLNRADRFTYVGHCEVDTHADKNYRLLLDTEGECPRLQEYHDERIAGSLGIRPTASCISIRERRDGQCH